MLWMTYQLYITLIFIVLCYTFYYSRMEKWFSSLNKPFSTKALLLAWLLAFVIIFMVWQCNPELSNYFILALILNSLWFMYFFGVSNYNLSIVVLILILINTIFGLMASENIKKKNLLWVYLLIIVTITYYNFRVYLLNVR